MQFEMLQIKTKAIKILFCMLIMSILSLVNGTTNTSSAQEQSQEKQHNANSLGISFKHPDNWKITYDSSKNNNCQSTCLIALKDMDTSNATLSFSARNCNCEDLLTQVKRQYVATLEPQNISMLHDNQTQLKDGTNAWQLDYSMCDRIRYILWFIHDDIFYELNYQNNKEVFSTEMPTAKKIIDSIKFFPKDSSPEVKNDSIKQANTIQPSFMNPRINQTLLAFTESNNTGNISSNGSSENETKYNLSLDPEMIIDLLDYYPAVTLELANNSTVVLKGDEEFMLKTEYNLSPFWEAIDTIKQFGYNLDEVTESGMGSVGNPTRFYAIMSLDTIIDNSTLNRILSK